MTSPEQDVLDRLTGAGNWKVFYTDGSGDITELSLGASGTFLKSNGAASIPSFAAPAGSGDVVKVGTPVNNQIGVWTGDGTLEGDADFTWDAKTLSVENDNNDNAYVLSVLNNDSTNDPDVVKIVNKGLGRELTMYSQNAIGIGACLNLVQDSPSAGGVLANGDNVGSVFFWGIVGASEIPFGDFGMKVTDVNVAGDSEDSYFHLNTFIAGTKAVRIKIGDTINGIHVGDASTTGIVSSNGSQDLTLQTGNATTGTISIADGADGDISFTPNGAGNVIANTDKFSVTEGGSYIDSYPETTSASILINDGSSNSFVNTFAADGNTFIELADTGAGASGPVIQFSHLSASPVANDIIATIDFSGRDGAGNNQSYSGIQAVIVDTTSTQEDGKLVFYVTTAGSSVDELELIGSALYPTSNDGLALGTSSLMFSDLFLASGAVVNFNNGDVLLTHSADTLTLSGGTLVTNDHNLTNGSGLRTGTTAGNTVLFQARDVDGAAYTTFMTMTANNTPTMTMSNVTSSTAFNPTTNDGSALGTTALQWSDLFLAEGGVINFDNGDLTLTQSGNSLTIAGGDLVLAESTSVQLDPVLSADGTWTGITMTGTAGYTQAFGDLVYLDPTDSRWEAADANAASGADGDSRGMLAMVVVAGTDGNACTLLLQGNIRADAKFDSFTVNNPMYVSETAGAVTQTQPTTTDVVIRFLGAALDANTMYFAPDKFWYSHT